VLVLISSLAFNSVKASASYNVGPRVADTSDMHCTLENSISVMEGVLSSAWSAR